ncbi:Wzt carbohydrate-binding domain-containing protein, partial [Clostridium butyricum]
RTGNRYLEIKNIKMADYSTGKEQYNFKCEDKVKIEVQYIRNNKKIYDSVVGIGIFRQDGLNCYGTNSFIDNSEKIKIKDEGVIEILLDPIQLLEGVYTLDIALHDEYGKPYDYIRKVKSFSIYSSIKDCGVVRIKHKIFAK